MIKRLSVFCGSSSGNEKIFEQNAYELGKQLALSSIGLVYGGAKVGLMGAVANGVLDNDGEVIGVLPRFLQQKELAHEQLSELILVETMHQRKTMMNELSDGVITLPGGYGTMEEFFEMITWAQLGLHKKPVAILNAAGFYDELLALTKTMVKRGFLKEIFQSMLIVDDNAAKLIGKIKNYQAPILAKWISKDEL